MEKRTGCKEASLGDGNEKKYQIGLEIRKTEETKSLRKMEIDGGMRKKGIGMGSKEKRSKVKGVKGKKIERKSKRSKGQIIGVGKRGSVRWSTFIAAQQVITQFLICAEARRQVSL